MTQNIASVKKGTISSNFSSGSTQVSPWGIKPLILWKLLEIRQGIPGIFRKGEKFVFLCKKKETVKGKVRKINGQTSEASQPRKLYEKSQLEIEN